MIYFAKTHIGNVRKTNEDSFYIPPGGGLFALVADGMGGHNAGDVASRLTADTVVKTLDSVKEPPVKKSHIKGALHAANKEVWTDAKNNPERQGMGSTVTLAVFSDSGVTIGQVGDSRAYLYRNGKLEQITKDHSYVQLLVDNGFISKTDALTHPQKNIITRAIGTEKDVEADIIRHDAEEGDVWLLCTDGLNSTVSDETIAEILCNGAENAADALIEAALKGGGHDNITVVIATTGGDAQ